MTRICPDPVAPLISSHSQSQEELSRGFSSHAMVVCPSTRGRLTADGLRTGALLVKARKRLWGPMLSSPTAKTTDRGNNPSKVEAVLRGVDKAVDTLCTTLGLKLAA